MKKGFEPLLRVPNRMCFNPCAAITLPHSFEDIYSNIYSFRRKNIYSHLLVDDLSRLSSGSRVFGQAHAIVIFNFQSAFNQNLKLLFQSELSIRLQWTWLVSNQLWCHRLFCFYLTSQDIIPQSLTPIHGLLIRPLLPFFFCQLFTQKM